MSLFGTLNTRLRAQSISALILGVVSALIIVQFSFIAIMLTVHLEGAQIVSVSGMQGVRIQHIGYAALTTYKNQQNTYSRNVLRTEGDHLSSTHTALLHLPIIQRIYVEAANELTLHNEIAAFALAAHNLSMNANDKTSFLYITTHEDELFHKIDQIAYKRASSAEHIDEVLLSTLTTGLVVLLSFIFISWTSVIAPLERRSKHHVLSLEDINKRLGSKLSLDNDAVFTIDCSGKCVDVNSAAEAIFQLSRSMLLGTGYLVIEDMVYLDNAELIAELTKDPENLSFSGKYVCENGSVVYFEAKITPILVDNTIHGAYITARDVTRTNALARMIEKQALRMQALCSIAASKGGSFSEQIDEALQLAFTTLSMDVSFLGHIEGDNLYIESSIGSKFYEVGSSIAIESTYVRQTMMEGDVITIGDLQVFENTFSNLEHNEEWHAFASSPLVVAGRPYGVIGFLCRHVVDFNELDKDFIRLVTALISTTLERRQHSQRLDKLAFYDTLTGLPNRAKFMHDINAALELAKRNKRRFCLHFVDLDGFKAINDTAGHPIGDLALQEVASRLQKVVRIYDIPARLGGDEFVILQQDVNDIADAQVLAGRIIDLLKQPYILDGKEYILGASIGIAMYPDHGLDVRNLLQNADMSLYRAKTNGKGHYSIFDTGEEKTPIPS